MTHHTPRPARSITDLATPAVVIDIDALEHNLAAMSERLPGALLRPHVKAHKSTALAAATFMLALRAEGYDSCPMEGFDPWRAKALLDLPRGAEVSMFLAVGRRGEHGVWWDRVLMPRDWAVREL